MDCEYECHDIGLALAKLRTVADLVVSARDLTLIDANALGLLLDDLHSGFHCALNPQRPTTPKTHSAPATRCPKASRCSS